MLVNKVDAVLWLYSEGFVFEREVLGLNKATYERIISKAPEVNNANRNDIRDANNEGATISIRAVWADEIESQVAKLDPADLLILEMKAKKQYSALIHWLRGKTFSDAYNIANPPTGERSGDMASNGKRYCKTAYKALSELGVTIGFAIDDIKGK